MILFFKILAINTAMYFVYRTIRAYRFRKLITSLIILYAYRKSEGGKNDEKLNKAVNDCYEHFIKDLSMTKLIFTARPITLEEWFSKQAIDELKKE